MQEYPFSREWIHVKSPDPYDVPDFDAGFLKDPRDIAPLVWGYIKSRETARRMNAYAGEVTWMHPNFASDSPARAHDLDLATTKEYGGPSHITAGIQHGKETAVLAFVHPLLNYGYRFVDRTHRSWKASSRERDQLQSAGNSGTHQIQPGGH